MQLLMLQEPSQTCIQVFLLMSLYMKGIQEHHFHQQTTADSPTETHRMDDKIGR